MRAASLLVLTLALAGCPRTDAVRAPAVIGAVLPLTGPQAVYGVSARAGIELAVDEANARAGGRPIRVVFLDDRSSPRQAGDAAERLVAKEGAQILLGALSSGAALQMAPVAQRARVPLISASATAPEVTRHGPFVFRVCVVDPLQAQVIARFARGALDVERFAVLRDLDSTYSMALAKAFEAEVTGAGGEVVAVLDYAGAEQMGPTLARLAAAGPQAVYVPGYVEDVRRVLDAAAAADLDVRWLGGDGWDAREVVTASAAEGAHFVSHFAPRPGEAAVARFEAEYRRRYNEAPDAHAALAYDAARVALSALEPDPADGAAVAGRLAAIRGFDGVTGRFDLSEGGDPKKSAFVLRVEGGARRWVKTVSF